MVPTYLVLSGKKSARSPPAEFFLTAKTMQKPMNHLLKRAKTGPKSQKRRRHYNKTADGTSIIPIRVFWLAGSILVTYLPLFDPQKNLHPHFWYFWLTIQNTASRQVRNLFYLVAVFISFPLARCAPPPHPSPILGREVPKKRKENRLRRRWRFVNGGNVCVGVGVVVVAN
jgi:hypothetical protein